MRLIPRRRPAPDEATANHLVDHSVHRHFVHPTDHVLPQGAPNRGDELVWVETRIELHAAAGTLDDGNPHILDAEILQRLEQWDRAVEQEAESRRRTAHALHAEETRHLVRLREELADLRPARAQARAEDAYWRGLLLGADATRAITTTEATRVRGAGNAPSSVELTLADPVEAALPENEPASTTQEGVDDASTHD